ncbi:MAG: BatA domain-containing protein [Hyphomicrobium sp.]
MSFGALAFLNPWLLAALVTLPVIYWLLRAVPPSPRQVTFPPTRILAGIENEEKTPAKSPWWLTLLRLLAAGLLIFALAEPVLNPSSEAALGGSGPVAVVVDNGWASASHWSERARMIDRIIAEAEGQSRPVVVLPTASTAKTTSARIEAPAEARSTAAALTPQSFAPDRLAAAAALATVLAGAQGGTSIVWLSDDIDHDHKAAEFAAKLRALAQGGHLRRHRGRHARCASRRRGKHRRERQARSTRAAPAGRRARRLRARHLDARAEPRRGAVRPWHGKHGGNGAVRPAAGAAQPDCPRRGGRRALRRGRQPHRFALPVAPRGAHLGGKPRAGAAAAGAALLHREGACPLRRADQAEGLQPRRRHPGGAVAERQRTGARRHRHAVGRGRQARRELGQQGRRAGALCGLAAGERRR